MSIGEQLQMLIGIVVGYSTITLPAGQEYGMYAMPFDSIGGEGTEISIQDLFPNPLDSFKGGTAAGNSDQLMFWDSALSNYRTLYMCNATAATRYGKWINNGSVPSAWGAANQPSKFTIKGGTAFWVKRNVPTGTDKTNKEAMAAALPVKTVTVSGQVITKQTGVAEYDIYPASATAGAYTLICAGFTAAFYPNADTLDKTISVRDWIADGCKGGTAAGNSDQLMIWNGEKNSYYSLYLASAPAAKTRHNHWINNGSVPSSWGSANQPTKAVVQPTEGFWYFRQKGQTTSCKFKVDQPYSL